MTGLRRDFLRRQGYCELCQYFAGKLRELFDCDRTIRIIPVKLFRLKLKYMYVKDLVLFNAP